MDKKIKLPLKVDLTEALQQAQFLVDDLQFSLEELGLFRIRRQPVQLLFNPLSYLQIVVMNGVQLLMQSLDANGGIHQEISCK